MLSFRSIIVLFWATNLTMYTSQMDLNHQSSWTQPATTTLFVPGILSDNTQQALYCSSCTSSSGEIIKSSHGNQIFNGAYSVSCNFPEIEDPKTFRASHPSMLNAWAGALAATILGWQQKTIVRLRAFNPQDGTPTRLPEYKINFEKISLGQDADVECLSKAYDTLTQDPTKPDKILAIGFSRGAPTLLSFMATKYATKEIKRIKALVLESGFSKISSCMSPLSLWLLKKISSNFSSKAPSPLKLIPQFVHLCNEYDIPVLFIAAKKDRVVPYKQTYKLYRAAKKAGLKKGWMVSLEKTGHNDKLLTNQPDRNIFHAAVHAFYKEAGLSYIPYWAEKGQIYLAKSTQYR